MRREPGCEVSYLELVTLPSAPFWARRHTRAALHAWQLHPDTVETAELLVSELVTNTLKADGPVHQPNTGIDQVERIALTLRLMPGRVVIEVFDNDPNPPVMTNATDDAESGRGLMLVQALSKEWGHHFLPSGGKTVYCILSAPEHPDLAPEHRRQESRERKETPMPAPAPAACRNPDSPADQALTKIIDLLLDDGYDFTIPAWDGDAYLKISNALGALTNLTITSEGNVTWEYRSTDGSHVDPAKLVAIAISLLDPDSASPWPDRPPREDPAPIHVAASDALRRFGLTASRQLPELSGYTVLTVTNPAQPARGTVEITDDGELSWHTRAPHHRDGGLTLPDIAATISRALAKTQHTANQA